MFLRNCIFQMASILTVVFMSAFVCRASFYHPPAPVRILSEYTDFNTSSTLSRTQIWNVVPEDTLDGTTTLRFFPEALNKTDPVCEIYIPAIGATNVSWKGIGKSNEKTSCTGLLLVPGFPAPCDILPISEKHEESVYRDKTGAGGSVFIKYYRISSATILVPEAKANGWIKEETQSISELVMITVTDEKGQMIVRQLWNIDGSWWLYEETTARRSWLIH